MTGMKTFLKRNGHFSSSKRRACRESYREYTGIGVDMKTKYTGIGVDMKTNVLS